MSEAVVHTAEDVVGPYRELIEMALARAGGTKSLVVEGQPHELLENSFS